MEFAGRHAASDLHMRATYTGYVEFSVLGQSLNHMANAVQDVVRSQERRSAELEQRVLARTAELAKSEDRFRQLADLLSNWW